MNGYSYLKRNSMSFYSNARDLFHKGELNLAAFNIEQAMQLYLKYLLAVKLGDYPKTHSLRRLFKEAGQMCPKLEEFYRINANVIGNIESAYIMSRYFPVDYTIHEVEEMLRVLERFMRVVEECLT